MCFTKSHTKTVPKSHNVFIIVVTDVSESEGSVREFIQHTKSVSGHPLFVAISDCIDGQMALLVQASNYSEATQWLSLGLLQVAQAAMPGQPISFA